MSSTVNYLDWPKDKPHAEKSTLGTAGSGLSIPSAPMVANVEDEVELYIDFVATGQ